MVLMTTECLEAPATPLALDYHLVRFAYVLSLFPYAQSNMPAPRQNGRLSELTEFYADNVLGAIVS